MRCELLLLTSEFRPHRSQPFPLFGLLLFLHRVNCHDGTLPGFSLSVRLYFRTSSHLTLHGIRREWIVHLKIIACRCSLIRPIFQSERVTMNTGRLRSDRWRSNSFLCVLLWFFYAIVLEGCYYDGFQKCLSVPGGKLPSLARYQKWGSSSSDNGIPNLHQYPSCHID